MCVNVRHFSMSRWTEDLIPTQDGVSFKIGEWNRLRESMPEINAHVDIDSVVPCYASDDHMNQEGYFQCPECSTHNRTPI
jgi:hypothetical protein